MIGAVEEMPPWVLDATAWTRVTVDRMDWKLSVVFFQKINAIWGPLEVDLFATRLSTQLD